ncbi:MAG: Na+/H+ antiporter subunit E [Lachnospiraceae bacterium]|nr:Na+/H+ antiporter subunit E [Lachnospiraceae bacterium]
MAVFVFLLWLLLNGVISLETVIIGAIIAGILTVITYRILSLPLKTELLIAGNLPVFILYSGVLVVEIFKAAFAVMRSILRAEEPDPMIVEFESGFDTDVQNVLLANSITLTPGTITVFQEKNRFVVHCLHREYADGIEKSPFVRVISHLKF